MESKIVHIFQGNHKFVRKFVSWYQLKIEFTVMSEPGYRGDRFYQIFLPYLKWENIMPTTLLLPAAFSNLPTALQCRNKTDNCWFIHEYIYYCHCEMFWSDLKRLIEQCCIGICYIIMSVVEFPKFKVKHLNLAWRFAYIQQKHHRDVGIIFLLGDPLIQNSWIKNCSCLSFICTNFAWQDK